MEMQYCANIDIVLKILRMLHEYRYILGNISNLFILFNQDRSLHWKYYQCMPIFIQCYENSAQYIPKMKNITIFAQ